MGSGMRILGRPLAILFSVLVGFWVLVLIALPTASMILESLETPPRLLDSNQISDLVADANTCQTILSRYAAAAEEAESQADGPASITAPSIGGMAVPSIGGGGGANSGPALPFIIHCDRTRTDRALGRLDTSTPSPRLNELYGLPVLSVDHAAPIDTQLAQAADIEALARDLVERVRALEADQSSLTTASYGVLLAATQIPRASNAEEETGFDPVRAVQNVVGLRFETDDGHVYERIPLDTLAKTLVHAAFATLLALLICYPIAYKLTTTQGTRWGVWLFVALVIPYAIAELIRIYALLSIFSNFGLANHILSWFGLADVATGDIRDVVRFQEEPGTIFFALVYTYNLLMVFSIYNVMSTMDWSQVESASDLGARSWRIHWRVIMPYSKPGISVGCILTFMLAAGAFSVPQIMSRGLQAPWFSSTIYEKYFENHSPEVGSAYATFFVACCLIVVAIFMVATRTRLRDFMRT
ncbi:MAG: ABC transporter permease subunit [Rhodospirillaceae bacterium]|nr:ABC transporter permease subunit [Rhodospirillaceae bacterium]